MVYILYVALTQSVDGAHYMPLTLKHNNKPSWVFGYTTRNHLIIDLDNTSYFKVSKLVDMLMRNYPEIGHCLILQSSTSKMIEVEYLTPLAEYRKKTIRNNYHAVFNNFVNYEYCCNIIEALAILGAVNADYVNIRKMRQDMTLRVSKVVNKESIKKPPLVMHFVINPYAKKQEDGIYLYMQLYKCFMPRG